jgi:hypothetical protein
MYDDISGWHAGVETDLLSGLRLLVPTKRVAEVCRLRSVHQIPHEIEPEVSRTLGHRAQPQRTLHEGAD